MMRRPRRADRLVTWVPAAHHAQRFTTAGRCFQPARGREDMQMDIIRAWKDPFYRSHLSDRDLASMPASPAGLVVLSDDALRAASGLSAGFAPTACICWTD